MSQFETSVLVLETSRQIPAINYDAGTNSASSNRYLDDDSYCSNASDVEKNDQIPVTMNRVWRRQLFDYSIRSRTAGGDTHEFDISMSLIDWSSPIIEPLHAYIAEYMGKAKSAKSVYQAYLERIEVLKNYAVEDGINYNKASEQEFLKFLDNSPFIRGGLLALLDNGNLRAEWDDGGDNRIGMHFLGNHMIRYVIFRRQPTGSIARVTGCDTQKSIRQQIKNFNLNSLVYT